HDHAHGAGHGPEASAPVEPPKVFLDKSPRIVEYQLQRLTSEQLLLVERSTDDVKYLPVYRAILTREGMSRAHQQDALGALVRLNASDEVTELAAAVRSLSSR